MNLKIAIIDDDKVQLKFIEKVISQVNDFNLDIFTAQTQAGLYKILAKENIDAILCDYYLEQTTGFDIYKQLQLKDINTPFILFSSNENEEIIEKSIKNGVYDFLIKNQISPLSLYKLFYKIVCTVRDNQKHLKTIEEVKALKFLSGKSPTLQMITDDNGNIIFVNKELLTFLNISRNNILDRKYFDVIKDIDFDNSITINEFKDFEESFRKRIRIVHNNKLFHFNLNITEFRINSNKRFFATLDDVTEQNYLLQEFNDTREKLTILSNAVTEGIMLVKDGLIVEHNTQTLSIFNYDKSLIGQRMEKLFPKKSWTEISQKYVDGKEYIFETIGKTNCNKQIFLKIHTKDIRYNNQRHSVVIVRDISKEKSIIKKLQRARQKADRANTAKTDFLAKVTHELRTPLHSIAGFTDILLQGIDGPINNTQKESLSRISNSSSNLLEMIDNLLDLTKIDLGKLKIEKQEIDLNKVAKSVFESVRPLIHNSSQNLKLEISDSTEIVFIDESRIRQVVLNLVSNAIKFCPSGDIVISTESDPQYNIISVYDTGIGLDKDEIEKIFKDFEQANSSISSNFGGTGLGLSISRKIVLLHNGKITVKSKKGVFTKFSVLLPKQKNKKNTVSKNSEEAQKLLKEKILVLDDDTSFSGIIEKFLHFVNYRVKIISNPVKSVKEALDFKPDLLITDIMMPVMDGLQVVQKFRENPDLKDIKIITISGYLDSELTKLIDADGALQKPFRKEELFNLIRKVLDRSEDK